MLKYEYENATVYITKPTEKHMKNIRKATEKFLHEIVKEQTKRESRRNNRRASRSNSDARTRTKRIKRESK